MRLEAAEILNPAGKALALVQMTGRMLVALDPVLLQGEVNRGPAQNGRGQRMFGFQSSRGRRQDLLEIAIEFVCTGEHEVRRLIQRWTRVNHGGPTSLNRSPHRSLTKKGAILRHVTRILTLESPVRYTDPRWSV